MLRQPVFEPILVEDPTVQVAHCTPALALCLLSLRFIRPRSPLPCLLALSSALAALYEFIRPVPHFAHPFGGWGLQAAATAQGVLNLKQPVLLAILCSISASCSPPLRFESSPRLHADSAVAGTQAVLKRPGFRILLRRPALRFLLLRPDFRFVLALPNFQDLAAEYGLGGNATAAAAALVADPKAAEPAAAAAPAAAPAVPAPLLVGAWDTVAVPADALGPAAPGVAISP
jgi:hypothetical protein